MEFRNYKHNELLALEDLFKQVFTISESEAEGSIIGKLVRELITKTDVNDLYGFVASNSDEIIGATFFSRLKFQNNIEAFILSPLAVRKEYQRMGIAQKLINYGLQTLLQNNVSAVFTYGDIRLYQKVGFKLVSDKVILPPFKLSCSEGWLGQSLIENSLERISGKCSCVDALNNSIYW